MEKFPISKQNIINIIKLIFIQLFMKFFSLIKYKQDAEDKKEYE